MTALAIVLLTAMAVASLMAAGVGTRWAPVIITGGFVFLGFFLWLFGGGTVRKWDEIGRSLLFGSIISVTIAGVQVLIDEREQRRALQFNLSQAGDLSGVDLHERDLASFRLQKKKLRKADLHDADLHDADLFGTDLSEADLSGANLSGANLREAVLTKADLTGADLSDADLSRASMREAALGKATLRNASLVGTDMRHACLAPADLSDAKLDGADLTGAVLTGADLGGARLESDLRPAKLDGAGFARAKDDGTIWPLEFEEDPPLKGEVTANDARQSDRRAPREFVKAEVLEVLDGDTIRVQAVPPTLPYPGRTRLYGINAPNIRGATAAVGKVAHNRLRRLAGARVTIELATDEADEFGRALVYLWLPDGTTANEKLLEEGLASAVSYPKPFEFESRFANAQTKAVQRGVGIWDRCAPK